MLEITRAQVRPFTDLARARFVARMTTLLVEDEPQANGLKIQSQVEELIDVAGNYGLVSEQHTAVFIVTAWVLGTDLVHEYPPVREVLESEKLTPQAKALWLREWTESLFDRLGETLP